MQLIKTVAKILLVYFKKSMKELNSLVIVISNKNNMKQYFGQCFSLLLVNDLI